MRNFLTLTLSLLFLFFKLISARIEGTGYEYKDLEENNYCFISEEVSGWAANSLTAGSLNPPATTSCSNPTITYLMGGYGVLGGNNQNGNYFSRTFTGLKTHFYVRWTLSFYPMRSWDLNTDTYKIGINDLIVPGQTLSAGYFSSTICGTTITSLRIRVFGYAPHIASTLTFRVISGLDQNSIDEAFGFRELNILVDANPPLTPQNSYLCGRSPTTTILPDKQCLCPEGQWYNGGCVDCHKSCASCGGPTPRNCFQCKSGYSWDGFECAACTTYTDTCELTSTDQLSMRCQTGFALFKAANRCYFDCWYPLIKTTTNCYGIECTNTCPGRYIYWNKDCEISCNAPLQISSLPGNVNLCIYPCGSRDYLYWDGTCDEDCPIPFIRSVWKYKNFCGFPCSFPLPYLYPDSTCLSSCPFPLVEKIVHGHIMCTTPCNLPGEHVYPNGECSISCPWPLTPVIKDGVRYCTNTCSGANYLFWNGSCLATCPGPLKIRIERSLYYCDFPTDVPTGNFLYWDGTNSPTCYPPLRQRIEGTFTIRKLCDFPCPSHQYLYPDGVCSNDCVFPWTKRVVGGFRFCDYRCTGTEALFWNGTCRDSSNCIAPLILKALRSYQLCEFPSGNVSNFLYWDGTFSPDCEFPLIQRIDGNPMVRKFCESPCSTPTPYLWWDGVCRASCSPPFLSTSVGVKLFCSSPCANPDHFLYDDKSCAEDCNFPYVAEYDGAGKFCHFPCSKTSLYYYYNSSCLSACEFPLRVSVMEKVKWCFFPCSEDQFLYTNGTCIDTCEKPFNQYLGWDFKYCNNPCLADPLKPYLMWNGTCLSTCEAPMRIDNSTNMGDLCYGPCSNSEEFYYVKTGECKAECETSSIDNSGLYLKCYPPVYVDTTTFLDVLLESPKDDEKEGAVTLVKLARIVEYTRYLNIEFPSRLQRLAESKGRGIVTIRCGPEMPKSTKSSFTKYRLPDVFERYSDLHSNFLVNFWKEMTTWMIVVFAAILLVAAEEVCVKNEWTGVLSVVEKLRIIFKWNYLLILIGTSLGDIILYSSLQFRTFHAQESFAALSMEACLSMISLGVILLMGTFYVVRKVYLTKNDEIMSRQTISEALVRWKGYQVFYQGMNENIITNRIFYLLYAVRLCLPMFIASYLYPTPMTQTILYVVISVVTIGYIWLAKPIKRKLNYIQLIILEYFVLTINICLLILTCLFSYGGSHSSLEIALGDIIIFCNTGIHILLIVILILKIVQGCLAIHRYFKLDPKERLDNPWTKIIVGILQQGGMGFEEIGFEAIEYDTSEPQFDRGLMVTQKGISAKIRTWEAVHHDPRIVMDSNKRKPLRNSRAQEDNRLNTAESEDMSLNVKNYNSTDNEAYQINNPPMVIPPIRSAGLPKTYENSSLSDLVVSKRNISVRTDERNTVVTSSRSQKDTFVDPDIMQGIKLSHLKKMDLRSVEK